MGRPAKRESTGKAKKPNGKKQFNAALAEQLVLDFNSAAAEHGRDSLLEELIFKFLEKARPDSQSVLQFRDRRKAMAAAYETAAQLDDQETAEIDASNEHRCALLRIRELAVEIVEASTGALMRRPPKKAEFATHGKKDKTTKVAS